MRVLCCESCSGGQRLAAPTEEEGNKREEGETEGETEGEPSERKMAVEHPVTRRRRRKFTADVAVQTKENRPRRLETL